MVYYNSQDMCDMSTVTLVCRNNFYIKVFQKFSMLPLCMIDRFYLFIYFHLGTLQGFSAMKPITVISKPLIVLIGPHISNQKDFF